MRQEDEMERIYASDGNFIGAVEPKRGGFEVYSIHYGRRNELMYSVAEAREWVWEQHREHEARRASRSL